MASKDRQEAITRKGVYGQEIIIPKGDDHPQNTGSLLPPGNLCIQIVGRSGCGKSYLLGQIIPQISHLASVCICSTMFENVVYKRIEEWCEREDIIYRLAANPDEAKESLQEIFDDPVWEDESKWGLIIFDDFSERGGGSQRDAYTDIVVGFASRYRNKRQHFIFITQTPTGVPVKYRTNVNVRYLFTVGEQHGLRSILGDMKIANIDRELFEISLELVSKSKHGHLMIVNKGSVSKLYMKLDGSDEYVEPSFGGGEPDEPEFTLRQDSRLQKLVDRLDRMKSKEKKNKLDIRMIRKAKQDLHDYVYTISRMEGRPVDEILDEVYEVFDVDVR